MTTPRELRERGILGRLFGAQGANIGDLCGKDVPLHRVWEYRDIGRLFITVGGGRE